jgi:AraC-like DNA-binding protein
MLLTRKLVIENNSFKFRLFSNRYHIISIEGAAGYLSYPGCVVKIPTNGCILIPKNSLIHCALRPVNQRNFSVRVFRLVGVRRDIFLKLNFETISALTEVKDTGLISKPVIMDALYEKIGRSLSNESRVSDTSFSGKVFSVIRKDLSRKWELEDVCGVLYLSKTTLYRRLKEENTSLSELLSTARMSKAAHLLRNSRYSISVISDKSGFNSVSYFCKKFKESYGVTPKVYRSSSD